MQTSNGWNLLFHPAFLLVLTRLEHEAEKSKIKNPDNQQNSFELKVLRSLYAQVYGAIPRNPADPSFKLGNTLGPKFRHWLRAKFRQQYRIFFRYSSKSSVIVYAWANDRENLRAFGSKNDAYLVFKRMLESGKIPNSWDELLDEAKKLN